MEIKRMSRAEQTQRRKEIAAAITDSASFGKVAAKFGVSFETVRLACRIYAPQKMAGQAPRPRRRVPA